MRTKQEKERKLNTASVWFGAQGPGGSTSTRHVSPRDQGAGAVAVPLGSSHARWAAPPLHPQYADARTRSRRAHAHAASRSRRRPRPPPPACGPPWTRRCPPAEGAAAALRGLGRTARAAPRVPGGVSHEGRRSPLPACARCTPPAPAAPRTGRRSLAGRGATTASSPATVRFEAGAVVGEDRERARGRGGAPRAASFAKSCSCCDAATFASSLAGLALNT